MRVAVFQSPSGTLAAGDRLAALDTAMRRAAAEGAGLVICPELYMSGYNVGAATAQRAEAADGPFARAAADLAKRHRINLVYGFPQIDGRKLYNAAICISAMGETLAVHRKRVLPPGTESDYFNVGHGDTLVELGGITVALVICYEAEFPEAVRNAALAGAHLVAAPTALSEIWPDIAYRMMPTRALESGIYMAYANHSGEENGLTYLGASCIIDPDGNDLARARTGGEIIFADLSLEAIANARARLPYLRDRSAFGV